MKLNPFPVVGSDRVFKPWNIHHLNLSCLLILDTKVSRKNKWLDVHVSSMMSSCEHSLRKKHKNDVLMFIKETLHTIFVRASGIQGGPTMQRVFGLRDEAVNNCDTIFFISDLRFDLHSHTIVCDADMLPLMQELMLNIASSLSKLVGGKGNGMLNVTVFEGEMQAWKQQLPSLVE